jgi:membrane protease YdiL (CAAX protease family)
MKITTSSPFWQSSKTIITGFVIGAAACIPIMYLFGVKEKDHLQPLPFMLTYTVVHLAMLIYGQISLKSTFLHARVSLRQFAKLFSLFIVFFLIVDTLGVFINLPNLSSSIFESEFKQNRTQFFIVIVIIAPILEELIFRGLILDYLLKHKPEKASLLLSGLIFGLIHVSPDQVFFAFLGGIFLGYVYMKSQNLLVPIFFHALNNALNFIYLLYGYSSIMDFFTN